MSKWTIEAVKTLDDRRFVAAILNERKATLTNLNAPLARRIDATLRRLERADILEDGRGRFAGKDADGKVRQSEEEEY